MSPIDLSGLRVLNTRPCGTQHHELNYLIVKAGGHALSCPTLDIAAPDKPWFSLLPSLTDVWHAIFISANAATFCYNEFSENHLAWPPHILVTAVGNGTAKALKELKIRVDFVPEIADSEHLLALNSLQNVKNKTILLFKGEGGRTLISETLKNRAAKLIELDVYQRILPIFNRLQLNTWWRDEAVDIILLTSQQAMHNLFILFDKQTHAWLLRTPCLVISQRLADFAKASGMEKIFICNPETIIDTLHQFNKGFIHGK